MTNQNKATILENLFFFLATSLAAITVFVILFAHIIVVALVEETSRSTCFIGCSLIEARQD